MANRILISYGGWEGHKPLECSVLIKDAFIKDGHLVDVYNHLECLDDENLSEKYDLIILCWTMSKITKAQLKNLLSAIETGVGFAGWHGGIGDTFRDETSFQFMVGGQFVAHPGNIISYDVKFASDNNMMKGLNDFKISTECYYMHFDPGINVLATTTFSGEHCSWIEGVTMPVMWNKVYGLGRVFYTSVGHQPEDFYIEEVLESFKRGAYWACRNN